MWLAATWAGSPMNKKRKPLQLSMSISLSPVCGDVHKQLHVSAATTVSKNTPPPFLKLILVKYLLKIMRKVVIYCSCYVSLSGLQLKTLLPQPI